MEEKFWEREYKDFVDGVVVKFKKMSSLDVLDLADRNISSVTANSKQFKLDCLRNVAWTKDGEHWFDLMDESGNCTLQDLPYSTLLDIFFTFRSVVCMPVFTESRAYRSLSDKAEAAREGQTKKHNT